MKLTTSIRVWFFVTIIASGSLLLHQSKTSHADTAKRVSPGIPPKVDIEPEMGYGTLTGQFVLDGAIPVLLPAATPSVQNGADIIACGGTEVPNEKLVIDPKTKGIANIFVYLKLAPSKIHPKLAQSPESIVDCDQKMCRFEPRNLIVRVGQTLRVSNRDPVTHTAHSHPVRNAEKRSAIPAGDSRDFVFQIAEKLPINVKCDIHPWMSTWWLILDHPYAAVTDVQGKFAIGKLPAGNYEFVVWHEAKGYINKQLKVTIPGNGTRDLPVIKVKL
ncbi:MAG: hypothetical protein JWM11_3465 [Planctomycetaceae bacterium]|nr:hypothetical protein [Planctomycetaceae bacterium]